MHQYVPDWNLEEEFGHHGGILPRASQKNSMGSFSRETELVELLWQDGHVVMHSQNNPKPSAASSEFRTIQEHEPVNLIQNDEAVSWLENPIDDSLAKDFCSEFFSEMAGISTISADKMNDNVAAKDDKCAVINSSNVVAAALQIEESRTMPLPKAQGSDALNFSHFSRPLAGKLCEKGSGSRTRVGGQESSATMANGSSICGSNQILTQAEFSTSDAAGLTRGPNEIARVCSPLQSEQKHAHESAFPSSSGGSVFSTRSMGVLDESNGCQKRKQIDVGHEDQSEDLDESVDAKKPRRTRAAEVHNLSERRRRDRINERMKALQELIPHCNKTDKASMLDEAIEYLKSLQLQLQMMWMGSGMAQMMHPAMQQYMSGMGMGLAHASVPSMHQTIPLPSVPVVNQSAASSSGTNQAMFFPSPAANHRNLMQTAHCKHSHAPYFGFQHFHPHCQVMHQCAFGSHILQQQNQQTAAPSSSSLPSAAKGVCEDNTQETDSACQASICFEE